MWALYRSNVITCSTIDGKKAYIYHSYYGETKGVLRKPIVATIQTDDSEITNSDFDNDTISKMKPVY